VLLFYSIFILHMISYYWNSYCFYRTANIFVVVLWYGSVILVIVIGVSRL